MTEEEIGKSFKEYMRRYYKAYQAKKEKMKEYKRDYRQANKEKILEHQRRYREAPKNKDEPDQGFQGIFLNVVPMPAVQLP